MSSINISDSHVDEFMDESIAVSVTTGNTPISAHVNSLGSIDNSILQLSDEPLSTLSTVILAIPMSSRYTVTSTASHTGEIVSSTVTVAMQVAVAPLSSVTVNVTE